MRAYELMVIVDIGVEESAVPDVVKRIRDMIEALGARVAKTDTWGRRRFAYEIDHKTEGYYVVFELLTEPVDLEPFERALRLADDLVRHKLIRLPDREAARRGLLSVGSAAANAE